jgi:methylenetetrahydrofolate dehydrogenase (NADP+)/methenyltetrahydrofolate cyclohydrolase
MIMYGKPVADKIYGILKKEIVKYDLKPFMAVILIGDNSESLSFIRAKERIAKNLKIGFRLYQFPEVIRQDEIIRLIYNFNRNEYITGVVIQLPLPKKMDTETIINIINPKKDIDGFLGEYISPAAQAVIEILNYYKIDLVNKKIVIVGHGKLVGNPLEKYFKEMEIKPIVCDSKTINIKKHTIDADIIISATGSFEAITSDMVSKNAVIIDAGTAEVGGKITGDISARVQKKVESFSPVPGGVGPVTVACLMKNLVEAAKKL